MKSLWLAAISHQEFNPASSESPAALQQTADQDSIRGHCHETTTQKTKNKKTVNFRDTLEYLISNQTSFSHRSPSVVESSIDPFSEKQPNLSFTIQTFSDPDL